MRPLRFNDLVPGSLTHSCSLSVVETALFKIGFIQDIASRVVQGKPVGMGLLSTSRAQIAESSSSPRATAGKLHKEALGARRLIHHQGRH